MDITLSKALDLAGKLDDSPGDNTSRERFRRFLKTDIAEAEILTGTRDLRRAAKMLFDWGSQEIVLTHRDGVLVFDGRGYHEAGFYPRELVGRSGRGDTCIAAYSCKRLDSPPAEAVIWAAAITSLKMETDGPFSASEEEVEDLIERRYR